MVGITNCYSQIANPKHVGMTAQFVLILADFGDGHADILSAIPRKIWISPSFLRAKIKKYNSMQQPVKRDHLG
jgi:hypothetical protein